jgi:hypothetical protein
MRFLRLKLPVMLGVAALAAGLTVPAAASASSVSNSTCAGGSIAAGSYGSLTITGFCSLDSGNVEVERDVTVAPGGALLAAFSGSDLTVERNLWVKAGGLLALGCEPLGGDFLCFNNPAGSTHHSIRGSLVAKDATLVIVHHDHIAGDVQETGGGGGLTCNPVFTGGPPPYTDYNDDNIGGNVTVSGLHTCWDGFLLNRVWGSVSWNKNQTVIPDGNLMGTNTVHEDLNCFGNSPLPHLSDVTPLLNRVFDDARGQCATLAKVGD